MTYAKVNLHRRAATRWQPPILPPEPIRYIIRLDASCRAAGFGLLLVTTLVATFLYLTELVSVVRHDALYAALLAAAWSCYFASGQVLRTRRLGPALASAVRALAALALILFFGFVYWLVLTH